MEVDILRLTDELKSWGKRIGIVFLVLFIDIQLVGIGIPITDRLLFIAMILGVIGVSRLRRIKENHAHISKQKGIEDLVRLCNRLLAFENKTMNKDDKRKRRNLVEKYRELTERLGRGYVYFIQEDGKNYVKIGKAMDPYERCQQFFKIKVPWNMKVLHLVRSDSPRQTEHLFHKHFEKERVSGEWFKLSQSQIKWVKKGLYTDKIANSIVRPSGKETPIITWKGAFKSVVNFLKETRRKYRKVKRFFKAGNRRKLQMVRSMYRRK